MKYLILTLSICLSYSNLAAQNLERYVIGSSGISTQNENLRLSFTVGEAIVSGIKAGNIHLSQGFQQPNIPDITTGLKLPSFIDNIIAYPNPVGSVLNIDILTQKEFEFSYVISGLAGRQLTPLIYLSGPIGASRHQVDLTGLAVGTYLLTIQTRSEGPIKVLKIQKR